MVTMSEIDKTLHPVWIAYVLHHYTGTCKAIQGDRRSYIAEGHKRRPKASKEEQATSDQPNPLVPPAHKLAT